MGIIADVKPHMRGALLEIPPAFVDEVSGVLADALGFEDWRLDQDPVVADTPANRADYFSQRLAQDFVYRIRNLVKEMRAAKIAPEVDVDLGI